MDFLNEIIALAGAVLLAVAFGASSLPLVRFTAWWKRRRFSYLDAQPFMCRDCPPLVPEMVNLALPQRDSVPLA
jgi:hypothetical protein